MKLCAIILCASLFSFSAYAADSNDAAFITAAHQALASTNIQQRKQTLGAIQQYVQSLSSLELQLAYQKDEIDHKLALNHEKTTSVDHYLEQLKVSNQQALAFRNYLTPLMPDVLEACSQGDNDMQLESGTIITQFGTIDDADVLKFAKHIASNANSDMRVTNIKCLERLGTLAKAATPALFDLARNDTALAVRQQATSALLRIDNKNPDVQSLATARVKNRAKEAPFPPIDAERMRNTEAEKMAYYFSERLSVEGQPKRKPTDPPLIWKGVDTDSIVQKSSVKELLAILRLPDSHDPALTELQHKAAAALIRTTDQNAANEAQEYATTIYKETAEASLAALQDPDKRNKWRAITWLEYKPLSKEDRLLIPLFISMLNDPQLDFPAKDLLMTLDTPESYKAVKEFDEHYDSDLIPMPEVPGMHPLYGYYRFDVYHNGQIYHESDNDVIRSKMGELTVRDMIIKKDYINFAGETCRSPQYKLNRADEKMIQFASAQPSSTENMSNANVKLLTIKCVYGVKELPVNLEYYFLTRNDHDIIYYNDQGLHAIYRKISD